MLSLGYCIHCKEQSIVKKPYWSKAMNRSLIYSYCINKHCKSYDMYRHRQTKTSSINA